MSKNLDYRFKYVVIGESNVGKSSLLRRYITGDVVSERPFLSTVGCDMCQKILKIGGNYVLLQIWDTIGSEKFRSTKMTQQLFRNADGVILVYDITCVESFSKLHMWLNEVKSKEVKADAVFTLIGNKCDKDGNQRQVSTRTGWEWAKKHGFQFHECNATQPGVDNFKSSVKTMTAELISNHSQKTAEMDIQWRRC